MKPTDNIKTLLNEIDWLERVINQVIKSYFLQEGHETHWLDLEIPDVTKNDSAYATFLNKWSLNTFDRLALALSMAPHLKPQVLDIFFGRNQIYDRVFTEFGGCIDKGHSGFLPTGQTLSFLIVSGNPEYRLHLINVLGKESVLIKEQVLLLSETDSHIPDLNGVLSLSDPWMHYFLTGEELNTDHRMNLFAQKITTNMEWEDVVLNHSVLNQVEEVYAWLEHQETIMENWGLAKIIKPGYRALFYGPPGTGKTLTAMLLGKRSKRDVYKVDLSMLVSRYIEETEKNLSRIFDIAQHKDMILFFDEADALITANSSNDLYTNQQTAYLLKRIGDFPGTIIMASNHNVAIDEAFSRKFQGMIHFTIPNQEERLQLWKNAFSGGCTLDPDIDLDRIAQDYEIAGGAIINVLRFCALSAVKRNDSIVSERELINGIRREYKKENRTIQTPK